MKLPKNDKNARASWVSYNRRDNGVQQRRSDMRCYEHEAAGPGYETKYRAPVMSGPRKRSAAPNTMAGRNTARMALPALPALRPIALRCEHLLLKCRYRSSHPSSIFYEPHPRHRRHR